MSYGAIMSCKWRRLLDITGALPLLCSNYETPRSYLPYESRHRPYCPREARSFVDLCGFYGSWSASHYACHDSLPTCSDAAPSTGSSGCLLPVGNYPIRRDEARPRSCPGCHPASQSRERGADWSRDMAAPGLDHPSRGSAHHRDIAPTSLGSDRRTPRTSTRSPTDPGQPEG